MNELPKNVCHYFVDEAGDGTVFDRKGNVIIGQEGCSRYFMLGLLQIPDPLSIEEKLNQLRADLLKDKYFQKIPSFQPSAMKTALGFHAKNDIAEVKREVFKILSQETDLRFSAVVRDKRKVLLQVQQYKYKRYHPNALYDELIPRLFKDRLHKEDAYKVIFATRGKSDRTQALKKALDQARSRFEKQWNIHSDAPIDIQALPAIQSVCLQAADYFLWALQRCYEKREDRYIQYLWSQVKLVYDIDDVRTKKYGVYHQGKTPLSAEILPPLD